MSPFNKYETVGILISIALMAVTLSVLRFKTDILAIEMRGDTQQGAVVVHIDEEKNDSSKALEDGIEEALYDAFSVDGTLVSLVVDDVRVGTGEAVKEGDKLVVNYVGTTQDGVKFDSSYDRGETFIFTVGKGEVIQGWEKGLIGMKEGGQRVLVIPSAMAYGNRQVGPIPPNSPLVFAVELVEIR